MKFKYLDHTSEAKFQAFGLTLEESFSNCVFALFSMITDISKVKCVEKKMILLQEKSLESLLFDFVDKLIYHQDVDGLLFSKVDKITIEKKNAHYVLHAIISGDTFENYETHGHIKAPTYNDMFIKRENEKWIIQMVVDV